MKCKNHSKIGATGGCVNCGNFFCDKCLHKIKGKNYCVTCTEALATKAEDKKDGTKDEPKVLVQQQQQQNGGGFLSGIKFSTGCCIGLIIVVVIIGIFILMASSGY